MASISGSFVRLTSRNPSSESQFQEFIRIDFESPDKETTPNGTEKSQLLSIVAQFLTL